MTASLDRAVEAARQYAALRDHIGGCTDGGCVIKRPDGMHTNGGCKCSTDKLKSQRMMQAGQALYEAIAALPHLGVDREALHNALWCKVASDLLPPWQWNMVNDRVRVLEHQDTLIETNQEPGHAR